MMMMMMMKIPVCVSPVLLQVSHDALPVAQPPASKHWRITVFSTTDRMLKAC